MDCILTLLKKLLGDHSDAVDVQGAVFVVSSIVYVGGVNRSATRPCLLSDENVFDVLDLEGAEASIHYRAFLFVLVANSFAL